jgi:predicted transcriptional regulator
MNSVLKKIIWFALSVGGTIYCQMGLTLSYDTLRYSLYHYNNLFLENNPMLIIEYPTPDPFYIDPRNYTPSSNPFIFDNRSSSYYVPRQIRDELNLMMNRPKTADSMVPILAVPIIAAQIAANYIWVKEKSKIKSSNLLQAASEMALLEILWQKNPWTISQIHEECNLTQSLPYKDLQKRMQILVDNKLVKMKQIENGESQYFPACTSQELAEIIRNILREETFPSHENETLLSILRSLE